MPIIINEMIAQVRPDNETLVVDSHSATSSGASECEQKMRIQLAIDQEREERLKID